MPREEALRESPRGLVRGMAEDEAEHDLERQQDKGGDACRASRQPDAHLRLVGRLGGRDLAGGVDRSPGPRGPTGRRRRDPRCACRASAGNGEYSHSPIHFQAVEAQTFRRADRKMVSECLRRYVLLLRADRSFTRLYIAQLISFEATGSRRSRCWAWRSSSPARPPSPRSCSCSSRGRSSSPRRSRVLADRPGPAPADGRRADVARVVVCVEFLLAGSRALDRAVYATLCRSGRHSSSRPQRPRCRTSWTRRSARANVLLGSAWGTMSQWAPPSAASSRRPSAGSGIPDRRVASSSRRSSSSASTASFPARRAVGRHPRPRRWASRACARGHQRRRAGALVARDRGMLLSKTSFGAGMGLKCCSRSSGAYLQAATSASASCSRRVAWARSWAPSGPRRRRVTTTGRSSARSSVAVVVFIISYALLPVAPGSGARGRACVFAAHMGGGVEWFLSSYGLQRATPDAIRGRVLSIDFALVTATTATSRS